MKTTHSKLLAEMNAGAAVTCGNMFEMARVYGTGPVKKVRQGTLTSMARAGLITRPIEMCDGEYTWLQFLPTFAVEENEENWNEWAA